MDSRLLSIASSLFNTSPELLIPLSGGHFNAVYSYPLRKIAQVLRVREEQPGENYGILRIGVEDCPMEQTLGMLDFMHFLSMQGAPVVAPLLSINGHLLEPLEFGGQRYNLTAFEKATGTLAENILPSQWTDELFCSIGKAVGRLHRISADYQPSLPGYYRPQWYDGYEIREATQQLDQTSDLAREKLANLILKLKHFPLTRDGFGLIHGDLHFANFLIQADGQVRVIDFDDCVYGWFAMDVAMALFDVLVLYHASSEAESQVFAQRFLRHYLAGYRQEQGLPAFWLAQVPDFLKLKELCIYATLIGHPDIALPDTWVGHFMQERAERIANDLPYVDIDIGSL